MPTLEKLVKEGLVDDLIPYEPRDDYTIEQKKKAISKRATGSDLGGAQSHEVGSQFFNELNKREIGKTACMEHGCTHFMTMDADECWMDDQLAYVKKVMLEKDYEGTCCKMRFFFRFPTRELIPHDDLNHVPVIYKISKTMPFRLACPYPALIDPTRKLENLRRFHIFEREEVEMYHYSFVRQNIRSKLLNVSNRQNYEDVDNFVARFARWTPADGVIHPHPFFREKFKNLKQVDNWFGISGAGMTEAGYMTKFVIPQPASSSATRKFADPDDQELQQIQALKQEGTGFFKQGKYHDAKREYHRALAQAHKVRETQIGSMESKAEESTKLSWQGLGTLTSQLLLNLAQVHLKLNEPKLAIPACTNVLEIDACSIKALYRRAVAYESLGQYGDATEDLKAAFSLEPEDKAIARLMRRIISHS
jgi:tetratricopeptide (TPR) repeat protein